MRWHGIREILLESDVPPKHLAVLDEVFESAAEQTGPACRFLLAGSAGIVLDETLDAGNACENQAAVEQIPLLAPLIRRHAHDLPYLVVEAGRDGARISAFRADGRPVSTVDIEGETVHLTKVHGGGWAHRRFQQTAEEVRRRNAQEVAETVERTWTQAGSRMVLLAVDGIGATVHALRQGQVEYLMLDFDALEGTSLLALHDEPWVSSGPEGISGTSVLAKAPAVDVLIRAGALTDVRLLPAGPEAGDVGSDGVSALLRWPTGPQ